MSSELCDVAIVGCGPAGLSAAINAKVRKKSLILHGVEFCTAKLHKSPSIENYLGFTQITGPELREAFFGHLEAMGVEVTKGKITSIVSGGDRFILATSHDTFEARTIVLATGVAAANYLAGEKELLGRGVSYCATCDGALFRGKTVAVIGKGSEAKTEAKFLSEICGKVYWFGSAEDAPQAENIELGSGRPKAIVGDDRVHGVQTTEGEISVDGVFILSEVTPAEQLIPGLDIQDGAILVDAQMKTSIPGVFAAGDCTGRPYQLAKAVGQGQVAALSAVKYLDELVR